jgi:excisionase family DNA binding protein
MKAEKYVPGELLTVDEGARFLGVSREHMHKLIRDGHVSCVQVGKHRALTLSGLRPYYQRRRERGWYKRGPHGYARARKEGAKT